MNKKVSGAQSVIVPIKCIGKNYLPFVEDLKDRVIKYIDIMYCIPIDGSERVSNIPEYITLAGKNGYILEFENYPTQNLSYESTQGLRRLIGKKLSLQNSFFINTDPDNVGKSVVVVFWYDEPEYSARNTTNNVSITTVEVPFVSKDFKNVFPDNRTIAGKRFRTIAFDRLYGKTPSFKDALNNDIYEFGYITLLNGNVAILKDIPVACLVEDLNSDPLEFANIKFDLTNSYIKLAPNADIELNGNQAFVVRFAFEN